MSQTIKPASCGWLTWYWTQLPIMCSAGQPIELTAKEYALLEYFMRNPNRLITREMTEDHIWSYDFQASSNVVDVYIRRLRSKIDAPFEIQLFETVRGAGYRLRVPPPAGDPSDGKQTRA